MCNNNQCSGGVRIKITKIQLKGLPLRLYKMLEAEKYSKSTLIDVKFILQALIWYLDINCIEDYIPEIGDSFINYCVNELKICSSRVTRAKSLMRKLDGLSQGLEGKAAVLPDSLLKIDLPRGLEEALDRYLVYCAENGNRQSTIRAKYLVCGNFLKILSSLGYAEIQNATGEDIQTAFLAMGYVGYWERIRPFLRFLFESNILKLNYSGIIQNPRCSMPMPSVYSPEEILRIENSFDLSSSNGIRNYAITLLMTRYGIRGCDVAALTFDNIDFTNNRLHFLQQKTNDPWESALLPEVKTALQNYIENVRPDFTKYPFVFMKLTPPYAPLDNHAIHTMMFTQFKRSGIDCTDRICGSRALRSSVASNMINDGFGTEIVRKVLGHGTKHALKHYARIDIESMRLCPLPVPKPTGAFAEILFGKGELPRV
jgi:site-specific recombinase XerD